jgi:hypothetical protein
MIQNISSSNQFPNPSNPSCLLFNAQFHFLLHYGKIMQFIPSKYDSHQKESSTMQNRTMSPFTILAAILLAISLTACGAGAKAPQVTQAAAPTQVEQPAEPVQTKALAAPTAEPTAQPLPTEAPAEPTAEPTLAESTPEPAATKELPEVVKSIYPGTPVSYSTVGDFDETWAQIGYYQYWSIDNAPLNFVIRTDSTWSSASETANWDQSGCGFVYHAKDERNHAVAYLGLDGNVYVGHVVDGTSKLVGSAYYDKVDVPEGGAELMLMVNGDKIYFFVDGVQVFSGTDLLLTSKLDIAQLALTLVSGTNKDYGTRCQMVNTDLWDLGE